MYPIYIITILFFKALPMSTQLNRDIFDTEDDEEDTVQDNDIGRCARGMQLLR